MGAPRLDFLDVEFGAYVGGKLFQLHFAGTGLVVVACKELAERIGGNGYPISHRCWEVEVRRAVCGKDHLPRRPQKHFRRCPSHLGEKPSTCVWSQGRDSLTNGCLACQQPRSIPSATSPARFSGPCRPQHVVATCDAAINVVIERLKMRPGPILPGASAPGRSGFHRSARPPIALALSRYESTVPERRGRAGSVP